MSTVSFSGMSSGLDTDSIIDAMCATAKSKVTKSKQSESTIETKQSVWKKINEKINSFYTGTLSNMRLSGSFSANKITSSVSTVGQVKGTGTLPSGNHTLKVVTVAEKASLQTKKISYGSTTKTTAAKTTTMDEIFGTSKGSGVISTVDVKGTDSKGNSYGSTIELKGDMTIEELTQKLSSTLGNCNVSYNESLGAFSIYSKETGEDQTISLSVASGDNSALSVLGLASSNTIEAKGSNATGQFNGMEIDCDTNEIEIDGAKIVMTGTGTTTLSSDKDTNGVYDKIKAFVDEYNSLIEEISKLVDAEYTKLSPLTDDEKEDMTETEIKEHNEALEAAALRNDSNLRDIRQALRKIVSEAKVEEEYQEVDQNGNLLYDSNGDPKMKKKVVCTLSSIGISTSSNWKENGKLIIDEDKLKSSIENNSEDIKKLFSDKQTGFATMMYDKLKTASKGNTQRSTGSFYNDKMLTENLKTQQKQTTKLEERLETLKNLYLSKFTAMETMLSTINSQSSTISSYFGS